MRAVGQADRGGGARNLLHRHAMGEIAEARAAPLLFDRDAEKTERAELRPQLARKAVGAVDLVGARRDLVLGESRARYRAAFRDRCRGRNRGRVDCWTAWRAPPAARAKDQVVLIDSGSAARLSGCRIAALAAPRGPPAAAPRSCRSPRPDSALANRKPCISSQPASRSSTRCSLVSTPSASTFMPSA